MFLAVSRVFRGIMGCSRGVPGLFRAVPGCSRGCSGNVPGVSRGVPRGSRRVPGFTDTPFLVLRKFRRSRLFKVTPSSYVSVTTPRTTTKQKLA